MLNIIIKDMLKKVFILFQIILLSVLFLNFSSCKKQVNTNIKEGCNIDTLDINEFYDDKIPVILKNESELYKKLGKPDKILKEHMKWIIFKHDKTINKLEIDTILYVKIVWYESIYATYIISDSFVRLREMDFRQTISSIYHKDLILNYKTSFRKLSKKYPCSVDSIEIDMAKSLLNIEKYHKKYLKTLTFYTGYIFEPLYIRLYFNNNKLIFMSIDP